MAKEKAENKAKEAEKKKDADKKAAAKADQNKDADSKSDQNKDAAQKLGATKAAEPKSAANNSVDVESTDNKTSHSPKHIDRQSATRARMSANRPTPTNYTEPENLPDAKQDKDLSKPKTDQDSDSDYKLGDDK